MVANAPGQANTPLLQEIVSLLQQQSYEYSGILNRLREINESTFTAVGLLR